MKIESRRLSYGLLIRISAMAGLSLAMMFFRVTIAWGLQGETVTQTNSTQLTNLLYQSSIAAAEKGLRLHELRDARKWLDHAPEKLRHWEWQFLNAQCDESLGSWPVELQDVTAMELAPNGNRLAVATAQGEVILYRWPGFTDPTKIGDHAEAVYSVAFSGDSNRLVTVSRDMTSRAWDVASGKQISQIKLDNPGVAEACFSPTGEQVATCTWMMTNENGERQVHGTVWVWNAETGEVISKERVGVKPLDSIQWSSDGTTIVVGSWDGLVHVLNRQAKLQKTLTVPVAGAYTAVISVAISRDGQYIAAGSKDRTARVWSAVSGELVATMNGHDGDVNSLKFTQDGERLVTGSVDGTCRIWEANSGKLLQVLHGHTGSVIALALIDQDQQLLSLGRDQRLRVWDLNASYGGRMAVRVQPDGTYTTTFSPDGKRLYIACYDGHVRVLDTNTGSILADWVAHDASCNTLALSRDGSKLLTCSWDKTAKLWNTADYRQLKTLDAQDGVYDCGISPDGTMAALCVGNQLQVWNIDTGTMTGVCKGHEQNLSEIAFSPDGTMIATSASGESARIWTVATCEPVATLGDKSNTASTVLFSRDGQTIATGRRGRVNLWDCHSHVLKKAVSLGDSSISQLSFSADDARIAVASDAVYLIDANEGVAILRFQPNDDDIYFLSFSPDGSRLATCTTGGSIAINETIPLSQRSSNINLQKDK